MTLNKEQAKLRAVDTDYDEGRIKEVSLYKRRSYSVTLEHGIGFGFDRKYLNGMKPPKVGDVMRVYGSFGSRIRGIDLRGEPLYYRTPAEMDAEHEEWRAKHNEEKRKTFEKERRKLDREFAALPDVFQRRISWFRAWNPDFRWDLEAYEMSVCVDAVKIATAMKTPAGVERFRKMRYATQRKHVPDLYDGHSGNSFGAAVHLAWMYLKNPLFVIAEHGALTPLTGCEEYGCAHPRPPDVVAAIEEGR